jgi:hypothetical protein
MVMQDFAVLLKEAQADFRAPDLEFGGPGRIRTNRILDGVGREQSGAQAT